MTGGSLQKREFSLLGREREIEELAEGRKAAESRLAELRNAEAECSKALQEANAKQPLMQMNYESLMFGLHP